MVVGEEIVHRLLVADILNENAQRLQEERRKNDEFIGLCLMPWAREGNNFLIDSLFK